MISILGFYLLFAPVIAALSWIPLVGTLLSSFVGFAAILFATLVGLTLSTTIIAVAWVFFRPIMGVSLIALVSLSIYFTFYYDYTETTTVGELSTP